MYTSGAMPPRPTSDAPPTEPGPSPGDGPRQGSAVERLGGEERLRAIVDRFVDRVVGDTMIGFFFRSVDIPRLKQREYEFAASHLGGAARYTGRPLGRAHAPHSILSGQFNRRLKILENTLRDFDVPEDVIREWLDHNARLRSVIQSGGACNPSGDEPRAPEGKP